MPKNEALTARRDALPLPRPDEIDEDETASEPPDVAHDDRYHWPRPEGRRDNEEQKRPACGEGED